MQTLQATPVFNGLAPQEKPKAIALSLSFATTLSQDFDFTQIQQNQTRISFVQGVFIDNWDNPNPVAFTCNVTLHRVVCPANAQGYFPIFIPNSPKFTVSSTAGATTAKIQVLNFPVPAAVWTQFSSSGTFFDLDVTHDLTVGNDATIGNDLTVGNDITAGNSVITPQVHSPTGSSLELIGDDGFVNIFGYVTVDNSVTTPSIESPANLTLDPVGGLVSVTGSLNINTGNALNETSIGHNSTNATVGATIQDNYTIGGHFRAAFTATAVSALGGQLTIFVADVTGAPITAIVLATDGTVYIPSGLASGSGDLKLLPASGFVSFGTYSAGVVVPTGSIQIHDAAGTLRTIPCL